MTTPMPNPDPLVAATVDSDVVRSATARRPQRLLSLDVLRGLTIAFMIIVNDQMGPEPFSQLHHAAWNGFTATDLVFPTFLFLVGISTVLSAASRLARGATRANLFLHTARRAFLLIVLGFVVNNFPAFHMATARYYGVLPRIGVCYFVVASLYLVAPGWKDKALIAVLCLLSYWLLMRFVPVPGYGLPTHTVPINDRDGNLAAWLDRQIFSAAHLYEGTRDPEGLLSTIPAVATALFGMLAGVWLRTAHSTRRKAAAIAVAGLVSLCLGLAWDPFFPINKKLWTSSFVLFAGGWSMLLLALSVYVIDVLRVGRSAAESDNPESSRHSIGYTPLLVLGTNAITAYLISELGADLLGAIPRWAGGSLPGASFRALLAGLGSPQWASLAFSLGYLLLCWLPVVPLYRRRIFLRI